MSEIYRSEVFSTKVKHGDKSVNDYMFWKNETGSWHIVKTHYHVDYDPITTEMTIPENIINKMLTLDTKEALSE